MSRAPFNNSFVPAVVNLFFHKQHLFSNMFNVNAWENSVRVGGVGKENTAAKVRYDFQHAVVFLLGTLIHVQNAENHDLSAELNAFNIKNWPKVMAVFEKQPKVANACYVLINALAQEDLTKSVAFDTFCDDLCKDPVSLHKGASSDLREFFKKPIFACLTPNLSHSGSGKRWRITRKHSQETSLPVDVTDRLRQLLTNPFCAQTFERAKMSRTITTFDAECCICSYLRLVPSSIRTAKRKASVDAPPPPSRYKRPLHRPVGNLLEDFNKHLTSLDVPIVEIIQVTDAMCDFVNARPEESAANLSRHRAEEHLERIRSSLDLSKAETLRERWAGAKDSFLDKHFDFEAAASSYGAR